MQSKQKLNFQLPECAISLSFSLISSFVCGAGVKRERERLLVSEQSINYIFCQAVVTSQYSHVDGAAAGMGKKES